MQSIFAKEGRNRNALPVVATAKQYVRDERAISRRHANNGYF